MARKNTDDHSSSLNDIDRARIAKLGKLADPGRTLEYLTMAENKERQALYREQTKEKGLKRVAFYLPEQTIQELKSAFPGQRGGADWEAVINAALHDHFNRKYRQGKD
jgi:hypothetical protein